MKAITKKEAKKLWDDLGLRRRLVWDELTVRDEKAVERLASEYKVFLEAARTERKSAALVNEQALAAGFAQPGDRAGRLVFLHRAKAVALAWLGKRPAEEGLRIIGVHIDCPRLDMKTHPLYEEEEIVFLKSHYYGGIRKYQWLARPLGLIGVVIKPDGRSIEIEVGFEEGDPVFTVADLLPHLSRKSQDDKKVSQAFEGEKLNLIVGSRPVQNKEVKERFKLNLLSILKDRYGIIEEDFISAELEAVPLDKPADVGFDRALIGGYGHDDRVCAFAAHKAALGLKSPARPGFCLFIDKEEIGSEGNTSAQSRLMEQVVAGLLTASGKTPSSWAIKEILSKSQALSSDVTAAFDPDFPEVHEKRNVARLGHGPCLSKYGGRGGKGGANDANAEFVAWLRGVFDKAEVIWQAEGGMGKVDEGGGGTISQFMARHDMEVIDFGVPVLGMHSPFELISKADLYMTTRAMTAFLGAE